MEFYYMMFGGGEKTIHTSGRVVFPIVGIQNHTIIGIAEFRNLDTSINQLLEATEDQ